MPTICPHCHKMVSERPECANCGKKLKIPKQGGPDKIDREMTVVLMRYALIWVLGVVAVGVFCLAVVYILLS